MEKKEKCSIGISSKEMCSEDKLIDCKHFSDEDRISLNARSGTVVSFICAEHDKQFRSNYILNQKFCVDPYQTHSVKVFKSLKVVSFELYNQCKVSFSSIVPGTKLCISCLKKIYSDLKVLKQTTEVERSGLVEEISDNLDSDSAETFITADPEETPVVIQSSLEMQEKMSSDLSEKLLLSNTTTSTSEICSSFGETFTPQDIHFDRLNTVSKTLNLSPIKKKDLDRSKTYAQKKLHDMKSKIQSCFEQVTDIFDTSEDSNLTIDDNPELTGREIVVQLKNKFDNASKLSEKLQILSVLPSSWPIEKIVNTFGASSYMVRKVKQKVQQDGILFIPDSNKGHPLLKTTEQTVQEFFRSQDISRELPGRKDYKSVCENGQRVQKQKRLILGNLTEIYQLFREKYPCEKIGFSKFAGLRPPECVLAGASGTHVVCVCLIHENFKLLFHGAKLDKLKLRDDSQPLSSYRDCMKMVICQEPTNDCYFGICTHCPGSIKLKSILENLFLDNFIDEITCNQWTQVDRCSLETVIKSTDDYIDFFIESIPKVLQHDFIAKQQAEYFQTVKSNLEVGQVLVVADFSENYSFVLQNSVQGVYWNNTQATIHPFACYYRSIDGNESKLLPLSLIIISDNLTHNTTAVYSFQEELTSFLKIKIPNITKIIYFSDGAASQYKNRYNLVNLLHHEDDFKVPAEWHFHATSHGKGPSDGLGGLIKRLITRANLQKEADQQIQTPEEMCKWGQDNLPGVYCHFVSNKQIQLAEKKLSKRFKDASPVQGIRSCHAAIPISSDVIKIKNLSSSQEGKDFRLKNTDVHDIIDEPPIKTRLRKRTGTTTSEQGFTKKRRTK